MGLNSQQLVSHDVVMENWRIVGLTVQWLGG